MPPTNFKAQKRGGKGLIGFDLKEEDLIETFISANTHDNILFFTNRGKMLQTKVYEIPVAGRAAKGKSIYNYLDIPGTEKISAIVSYPDSDAENKNKCLVMITKEGNIKKTQLKEFENVRRTGIIAIKLKDGDDLKWVNISSGNDEIILSTALGQAIRFKEKDVRQMGRTAAGVRAIHLKKGDEIAGLDIIKGGKDAKTLKLLSVSSNGFAKQTQIKEYKLQKRGGSGIKTAKVTEKTGKVIATRTIDDEIEEVIAFSKKGQALRTKLGDIRIASRATQGVRIMDLEKGDELIGVVCL